MSHPGPAITVLAFDPGTRTLVGGDGYGGIDLWNCGESGVPAGPVELSAPDEKKRTGDIVGLHVQRDVLVAVAADGSVEAWRLAVRDGLLDTETLGGASLAAGGAADGEVVDSVLVDAAGRSGPRLLVGTTTSGIVQVDIKPTDTGLTVTEKLAVPPGQIDGEISAIALSTAGVLAIATTVGVTVWDRRAARIVTTRASGSDRVPNAIAYSTDGRTLAVASDEGVRTADGTGAGRTGAGTDRADDRSRATSTCSSPLTTPPSPQPLDPARL